MYWEAVMIVRDGWTPKKLSFNYSERCGFFSFVNCDFFTLQKFCLFILLGIPSLTSFAPFRFKAPQLTTCV